MLTNVTGIVLRCVKYSESSLIFDLYTRHHGLKSFIVSGVRKRKSRLSQAIFQVTNCIEVEAYLKKTQQLCRVKNAHLRHFYNQIPSDPVRRAISVFMAELAQKSLKPEQEPTPELYQFLEQTFVTLDTQQTIDPNYHLLFMIDLMDHLGFRPHHDWNEEKQYFDLRKGNFQPKADAQHTLDAQLSILFAQLLQGPKAESPIKLARSDRAALLEKFLLFYSYHLPHFGQMQSHRIFAQVL